MKQVLVPPCIVLLFLFAGYNGAVSQPTELVVSPAGDAHTYAGLTYWNASGAYGYRFYTVDSLQLKIMSGLNGTVQYTIDLLPGEWNGYYFYFNNWEDLNRDGTGDLILERSDPITSRGSFRIVNPVNNTTLISFDDPDYDFIYETTLDPGLDGHKNIVVRRAPHPNNYPYHHVVYSTDYSAGVAEAANLPREINVHQNYPNPFNPSTRIALDLPRAGDVTIDIYDVSGARIKSLLNERCNPGLHTAVWDGTTDRGIKVSSGTYYYHVTVDGQIKAKKMILLK